MYALDLHFAGTDTTSNTLLTGFLYLMNYPHIQGVYACTYIWIECSCGFLKSCLCSWSSFVSERCHQEIDKVLQDNEMVTYDARNQMPYMQVCMKNKLAVGKSKRRQVKRKKPSKLFVCLKNLS